MTGYSKTPLVKKLGIKSGFSVYFANPPEDYAVTLGDLPENVKICQSAVDNLDFIQFFTKDFGELTEQFPILMRLIKSDGMIWVSWPKKASKVQTDVNENLVRKVGLENGLVDVKVCAIDEVWSGLKFVYRLEDRA